MVPPFLQVSFQPHCHGNTHYWGTCCPAATLTGFFSVLVDSVNPPVKVVSNQTSSLLSISIPSGRTYWAVRTVSNIGLLSISAIRSFCKPIAPSPPILYYPVDGTGVQVSQDIEFYGEDYDLGFACDTTAPIITINVHCPSDSSSPTYTTTTSLYDTWFDIYIAPNTIGADVGMECMWTATLTNGLSTMSNDGYFVVCESIPPSAATLTSPSNGGFVHSTIAVMKWSQLDWGVTCPDCGSGGYYYVFWGTTSPPTSASWVSNSQSFSVSVTNNVYYWFVRAYNYDGHSTDSPIWSFTACWDQSPSAPSNWQPATTQVIGVYGTSVYVSFSWTPPSNLGV